MSWGCSNLLLCLSSSVVVPKDVCSGDSQAMRLHRLAIICDLRLPKGRETKRAQEKEKSPSSAMVLGGRLTLPHPQHSQNGHKGYWHDKHKCDEAGRVQGFMLFCSSLLPALFLLILPSRSASNKYRKTEQQEKERRRTKGRAKNAKRQ